MAQSFLARPHSVPARDCAQFADGKWQFAPEAQESFREPGLSPLLHPDPDIPTAASRRKNEVERRSEVVLYFARQLDRRPIRLLLASLYAQEPAKSDEAAPPGEVKKEEPAPAAPVPAYFTGTNDPSAPSWPDPTGAKAGTWITPSAKPIGDGDPSLQTPATLYDRIAHNMYSINMVWVLITGFLVMFMQAGFMLVEVGLCRAKNASHTAAMNLMVYPIGCIAFWVYGFALGWGNWFNGPVADGWYASLGPGLSALTGGIGIGEDPPGSGIFKYGLMGTKGFFLEGVDDVSVLALFFFMMVFMDTTATIPTGSMAERWSWKNFCLYGIWVALPYCIYANWVWGGGWLAQSGLNWGLGHGAVDFAGSGVVHAMGGVIALAGAICIGPRKGKFIDGKAQPMPGHHVPMRSSQGPSSCVSAGSALIPVRHFREPICESAPLSSIRCWRVAS